LAVGCFRIRPLLFLLARLLANYSVRDRIRPDEAEVANAKKLDFSHRTRPKQTRKYGRSQFGKPATAAEIDGRLATPEAYMVASPDQEIAVAS
jgi:hypothetical protein